MRAELLAWYDANARELPWRRTRDPYSVWVSEIMLQQTRVETVIPYYERFLSRFPDARSLAAASEDEVLASWSGLGYYRRARLLHAGVREVVERYGGEVPSDAGERRSLPGIGRYTAGAIGSICFDREEPIVDGNVARVLSRVFAIEHPLGSSASERALWDRAEELVKGPRPGDLNQALMELGATVCTPRSPRCSECPLASPCVARASSRQDSLPVPKKRKEPLRVDMVAVVATRADGAVALVRSARSLFGGLHAPPMIEGSDRAAALAALHAAGVRARLARTAVGSLTHVLSHRVLDVSVWRASHASTRVARLFAPSELDRIGVSSLTRRILSLGV